MVVMTLPLALAVPVAETVAVRVKLGAPGPAWKVSTTAGSLPEASMPVSVQVNAVMLQLPGAPIRLMLTTDTVFGTPVIATFTPASPVLPLFPNLTTTFPLLFPGTLPGPITLIVKPVAAAFTTRVTVVLCVRVPLVPVMVSVYVPAGVLLAVVTASVELPEPVTEVGVKLPLAPLGNPLALRLTVPVNPFSAPTVTE
jgi:hypothetical protein